MSSPSLNPLLQLTHDLMAEVNSIIVDRMQSEIDLIPSLAGHLVSSGGKRMRPVLTLAGALATGQADHRAIKLAAGFMAASGAAALDMVVMPDAGDAADHPAENQAE